MFLSQSRYSVSFNEWSGRCGARTYSAERCGKVSLMVRRPLLSKSAKVRLRRKSIGSVLSIKHKTSAARRRTAIRFSSRKGLQVLEKLKLDSVILGIRVRDSWMPGAWDLTSRPTEIALAAEPAGCSRHPAT